MPYPKNKIRLPYGAALENMIRYAVEQKDSMRERNHDWNDCKSYENLTYYLTNIR